MGGGLERRGGEENIGKEIGSEGGWRRRKRTGRELRQRNGVMAEVLCLEAIAPASTSRLFAHFHRHLEDLHTRKTNNLTQKVIDEKWKVSFS